MGARQRDRGRGSRYRGGRDGRGGLAGEQALFWDLPTEWADPAFDDRDWPAASVFTNDTVGVDNKPAYTHFEALFDDPEADAQFIWSSSLVLDNLVLIRGSIP